LTKLRFSATVKFWMVSIYENILIPFFSELMRLLYRYWRACQMVFLHAVSH